MFSRTPSRATSLLALFAAAALLLTACSDDSGESSSDTTAAPADGATTTTLPAGEAPSETPAANVRADLVALLEEQVYLTGFTVEEAAAAGGDLEAPMAAATAAAVADGSAELAEVIGGAYGVGPEQDFREAWDAHTQAVLDYALAGGDAEAIDLARDEVVSTLGAIDPEADFDSVASGLASVDEALVRTVEELAAGAPGAAVDLREATEEMPFVALDLATIIDENSGLEGEVDSEEAAIRADLTGLMQESALLTGLALAGTVQAGGEADAPGPTDVFAAVDENTEALADLLFPDATAEADAFTDIWSDHITAFEDYLVAVLDDDAAGIEESQDALVDFRDDVGELLAEHYPAFSKEAVAEELVNHTDSILAYADAVAVEEEPATPAGPAAPTTVPPRGGGATTTTVPAEAPEAPSLLREAALAMRMAARTFAGGLTAPVSE